MTSRTTRLFWLHALVAIGLLAGPGLLGTVGVDVGDADPVGEAVAAHEGSCDIPSDPWGCPAHYICFVIELNPNWECT